MKKNQKKRHQKMKIKSLNAMVIRIFCLLLLLFSIFFVTCHYLEPKLLPIRHIAMANQFKHINLLAVKQQMQPRIKGFFSTNVAELKQDITKIPFVDHVVIKRVWPDTLRVEITELAVVGWWNEGEYLSIHGSTLPLDAKGEKHLPHFKGTLNQAEAMLKMYQVFSAQLQLTKLSIERIELSQRQSWQITLNNGITLKLGRTEMTRRLQSFLKVYPRIKKKYDNNVDVIDLRHQNGFSLHLIENRLAEDELKPNLNKKP